ncbi:MAG: 50S ribosomal protein L25 [Bacteroidales bacterium]|jgi:large subunit ribosomal protein L25|nr:50S ribosomal protein L25 [Bacteroidales bacterium]MDT3360727.1 50S ribosomal protein L25 [Bacteroidota bacterium]
MKHFELKGQLRQVGNKAAIKAIRAQGLVPCNLYGLGLENVLFTVDAKDLKGLTHTPASYIVDLVLDGKKYTAVVHELQFHPIEDVCLHVDFLQVNEEKPIAIKVPLNITGHAAGVQAGGKFVKNVRELRISALMKNLPDQLDVDITKLGIGENIVAGDLKYEDITILNPKSTIICGVKATRQSAQAAPAAE